MSEFGDRVRKLFVGKTVVDVLEWVENEDTESERTGLQFVLDDETKVDVSIDFDEYDLTVEEH